MMEEEERFSGKKARSLNSSSNFTVRRKTLVEAFG
jgi:hypothetical protein